MNHLEIYIAIFGLVLSFFFAGAEGAFTNFNKFRLEAWKKRRVRLSENASRFVKHPEQFFATILVGNNLANILCTTFAIALLISYISETLSWILITSVILFFGEILPKSLFRSLADRIILPTLLLVRVFNLLLKPFIALINYFVERLLNFLQVEHTNLMTYFSREEMKLLLREGYEQNFTASKQDYICKVLGFSESRVREAMIPRAEMIAVNDKTILTEIYQLMVDHKIIRVPVYENNLDNIVGMVFIYDMLFGGEGTLREFVKPVYFVPESKSCLQLLREFQAQNISTAIVLDEYGGTAGIVTTHDLIEELFGEFEQIGESKPLARALNQFTWLIDARMELDDLSKLTGINFAENISETLAGFLLNHMGRIPKIGDTERYKNFRIEIIQATDKKIEQVKIILDRS